MEQTTVVRGRDQVSQAVMDFFGSTTKRLDICAVTVEPSQPEPIEGLSNAYLEVKKRGGTLRLLTEITPQNSGYLKEVERKGTDIRHLSGIGGNFAISDTEYVATLGTEEFDPRGALLRSNDQLFVTHHKRLFDLLWAGAMPAEQRFAEIERGLTPPKMEVLYDPVKIQKKYMDLIGQARSDVMLMLPTVSSFHRQESIGAIDSLSAMAKKGDVRVRVISPVDSEIEKRIVAEQSKSPIQFHRISPGVGVSVIIVVIDQEHSLVIEKVDDDGREFVSAVGAATYTTRQALVKSNAWLFEWLWNETGLIEQQVQERIQIQRSALRSSAAWEITPANYKCAKCGKQVVREIRVYDPRMMPAQSAIVSAAMKRNNAGWIPFCFECISSHPYSRPSWLLSAVP